MKQIIRDTKAYYCVECGKCSGYCPVARVNPDFLPRVIVEKAISGFNKDVEEDKELWTCLTCEACSSKCPSSVKFSEFVRGMRAQSFESGFSGRCSQGGLLHSIQRVMAGKEIAQKRLNWVTDDLKTSEKGDVLYFTGCLPYFDKLFSNFVDPIEIAKSTVKIMNKAGIVPAILSNERCCGHDMLWTGDIETFRKLAGINAGLIKESGATRIVTSCPECLRTLKIDYADYLEEGLEFLHTSELIASLIRNKDITLKKGGNMTYHDPCRLGRHLGIYNAPRDVINNMGTLVEMNRNMIGSSCCGVSAWSTCEGMSKQMQIDRLAEAKSTGSDVMITSCPKCLTHFRCALHNKVPVDMEKVNILVEDLTVAAAKALGGD